MRQSIRCLTSVVALAGASNVGASAWAQGASPAPAETATADNAILLTVFMSTDRSRPLADLNAQLEKQGFYKAFPPPGVEVVNWTIVMGIGQVVSLRLPASRLREVNRVFEATAWGPYHTEFYPTYDYKTAGMAEHVKAK